MTWTPPCSPPSWPSPLGGSVSTYFNVQLFALDLLRLKYQDRIKIHETRFWIIQGSWKSHFFPWLGWLPKLQTADIFILAISSAGSQKGWCGRIIKTAVATCGSGGFKNFKIGESSRIWKIKIGHNGWFESFHYIRLCRSQRRYDIAIYWHIWPSLNVRPLTSLAAIDCNDPVSPLDSHAFSLTRSKIIRVEDH